jgi:cell division protein FtsW (lipid II flippase)
MARPVETGALRRAVMRANTRLLLTGVMLFQFTGMLLLAIRSDSFDLQALMFAVLMPLVTFGVVKLFSKLWPVDRALLILTLLLCSISLVTLKDIARSSITPQIQAVYMLAGLVSMAIGITFIRHLRSWDKWVTPLLVVTFLALAAPLVFGSVQNGAKNWLKFGSGDALSVQPSEFGKLSLIFILSSRLSNRPRFRRCLPALLFVAAMCGLLLAEKDLGALLLYFLTTVMMFYAATSNLPITLAGLGMGAGGAVAAYYLFPYVAKRIELFQNPWSDPLVFGYQVIQALIAIGSGGMFGMGLGLGYPRNIPLYHSDFIFAAICEDFGLVFALAMLGIYVLILMRGASVAMNARTSFHALVAFGVVSLLAVQTLVIVGGNIKLIPLTGVTLPFVSAGGSSIVSMMGAMGMLLGVSSLNAGDEAEDLKRLEWREGVV